MSVAVGKDLDGAVAGGEHDPVRRLALDGQTENGVVKADDLGKLRGRAFDADVGHTFDES